MTTPENDVSLLLETKPRSQQHIYRNDVNDDDEVIDDWGNILVGNHFQLFAKHELYHVYIPLLQQQQQKTKAVAVIQAETSNKTTIQSNRCRHGDDDPNNDCDNRANSPDEAYICFHLLCVESLTPIDMLNMSYGIHDSTGHCVWTGSFLLIYALSETSSQYFANRRIMELGCGTGISSIAMASLHHHNTPSVIVMTDGDPESIQLSYKNWMLNFPDRNNNENNATTDAYETNNAISRRNDDKGIEHNVPATTITSTMYHNIPDCMLTTFRWGTQIEEDNTYICSATTSNCHFDDYFTYFDTVFATDVLYDIGLLPSLLQSATEFLSLSFINSRSDDDDHQHHDTIHSMTKYFVLSHVPRACYNSENPPSILQNHDCSTLEEYIIHKVCHDEYPFQVERIIRPLDLMLELENPNTTMHHMPKEALNDMSLQEMHEIGAAILIFRFSK